MTLSEYGSIVNEQMGAMSNFYDNISVDKYVVMPNHVHMIIMISHDSKTTNGTSGTPHPTNAVIPRFIPTLKRFTNKSAGFDLWQKSYHDHIIRDEEDYQNHSRYIDENAARWAEDEYYGQSGQ